MVEEHNQITISKIVLLLEEISPFTKENLYNIDRVQNDQYFQFLTAKLLSIPQTCYTLEEIQSNALAIGFLSLAARDPDFVKLSNLIQDLTTSIFIIPFTAARVFKVLRDIRKELIEDNNDITENRLYQVKSMPSVRQEQSEDTDEQFKQFLKELFSKYNEVFLEKETPTYEDITSSSLAMAGYALTCMKNPKGRPKQRRFSI